MGEDVLGDVEECKGGVGSGYDLYIHVWRCQGITKEEKEEEEKKGAWFKVKNMSFSSGGGGGSRFITGCL